MMMLSWQKSASWRLSLIEKRLSMKMLMMWRLEGQNERLVVDGSSPMPGRQVTLLEVAMLAPPRALLVVLEVPRRTCRLSCEMVCALFSSCKSSSVLVIVSSMDLRLRSQVSYRDELMKTSS